jgi:hypothetical protein
MLNYAHTCATYIQYCGAELILWTWRFAVIFSHRFVLNKYNSFIRASEIHVEKTYSVVLGGRQEAAGNRYLNMLFSVQVLYSTVEVSGKYHKRCRVKLPT